MRCADTVRCMHTAVGCIGKEAEGPGVINIKKYCMFSDLCVPGPQISYHWIRLVCLFHFYTQADEIKRATTLNKERMVKNALFMKGE